MPRSDGNKKRLTKSAKKRHNQATMARRQAETRTGKPNSGNSR